VTDGDVAASFFPLSSLTSSVLSFSSCSNKMLSDSSSSLQGRKRNYRNTATKAMAVNKQSVLYIVRRFYCRVAIPVNTANVAFLLGFLTEIPTTKHLNGSSVTTDTTQDQVK